MFPREIARLEPLSAAEQALVDGCVAGRVVRLGDARPEASGDAVTVRAAVIRVMALGGGAAHPTHERGVTLGGAAPGENGCPSYVLSACDCVSLSV